MATEMDVAKMMFGWGEHDYSFFSNFYTDGGGSGSTSVRYGTVVSIGENGQIEVRIDGSSETVWGKCDTPVKVGDRVSVVFRNGSYFFYAIKEFVQSTQDKIDDLNQSIKDEGEAIRNEVAGEIQQVEDAFNDFKQNHQLTDADINTKFEAIDGEITATVEGVIDDVVGETYATKSELSVAIDGITTSVSENYQSKTDAGEMKVDLESQIKQTSDAIAMEVSDRKEAVSGAIQESKTYFDVEAGKLQTKIEENVMNSVGENYTTKHDFEMTSEGFRSEISSAVSTANSASTTAKSANSTANSALSKANNAAKTATNYLQYSSAGLEVGNVNLDANVLVAPAAIKFRNGSTVLAEYGDGYAYIGKEGSRQHRLCLESDNVSMDYGSTSFLKFYHDTAGNTYIACPDKSVLHLSCNQLDLQHGLTSGMRCPQLTNMNTNVYQHRLELSTFAGYQYGQLMGAVPLYRNQPNGSNGTITLRDSITKYAFIDIVFEDRGSTGWRRWCQRVYNPSLYYQDGGVWSHHYGVYVALQAVVGGSSTIYPNVAMYQITDKQLVRRTELSGGFNNSNFCWVDEGTGNLYITHVIGWR